MPLSSDVKAAMKEAFISFDKDGSGTLTAGELSKAMAACSGGLTEDQCKELINMADTDGDKAMNFSEFIEIIEEGFDLYDKEHQEIDVIAEEFKNFDVNGDGHIDKEELRVAMQEMGEEVREEELEAMFSACDADGDKQITVEEFRRMCGN